MELYHAIKELYPNAEPDVDFVLQDDGNGAYIREWRVKAEDGSPVPEPSREELEQAYRRYLEKRALTEYREKRRQEYPPSGDQLDCIWKALSSMGLTPDPAGGENTPEGMLARILMVKEKYPKP